MWLPLAEERGTALYVRGDGQETVRAWLVPGSLEQVLDNLLSNAFEVSPAGGTVRIFVGKSQGRVQIHVADDGPGMTRADRARAFERFWQGGSDRSGSGGGTGLGLAIVRQLVRANGGNVELAPADGGGLDVVVWLEAAP